MANSTTLLNLLGLGSLILMIIGLVLLQHDDINDPNHNMYGFICKGWIGAFCLTAGWLFSSAYASHSKVTWPKWPFVIAHE
jgi:hypothetical protein